MKIFCSQIAALTFSDWLLTSSFAKACWDILGLLSELLAFYTLLRFLVMLTDSRYSVIELLLIY